MAGIHDAEWDVVMMTEWIDFIEIEKKHKTIVWAVCTKQQDNKTSQDLGTIKWHPAWRKYAFFPAEQTVFEKVCLRDIAQFLEEKTKEHKRFK